MKKVFLLFGITLLLSGCENKEYDYTCKKMTQKESFKVTETLKFGFDNNKIYKFTSNITEEHNNDESVNNSYANYQNLYDNYNENQVIADYKKNEKTIIVNYYLDKADIDNMKIKLPYDFKLTKSDFIKSIEKLEFKCEEN